MSDTRSNFNPYIMSSGLFFKKINWTRDYQIPITIYCKIILHVSYLGNYSLKIQAF